METATKKNTEEPTPSAEQIVIKDAVVSIGNTAEANEDADTAVFTASIVDGVIQIAAAGSMPKLVKLLAHAINADSNMKRVFQAATEAAPMLELFEMVSGEGIGKKCNCPACTAERSAAKNNVNVN